jgi:UrcA family protein
MNTKLNTTLGAFVLLTALCLSASGFAQNPDRSVPSEVVRYGDLDLSSVQGIRTLYVRLQNAAWRVCLQIEPHASIINGQCRRTLVEAAVNDLNKPALTALHVGKTPTVAVQQATR